jgi:hypothetical protein
MKAALLINGISLPHHVIDEAIKWAVVGRGSLKALFVYTSNSKYTFHEWPRNKAVTRFMSGDLYAEGNLIDLIDRHVQYTISCSAISNIVCEVAVIKSPSFEMVDKHLSKADIVFADPNTFRRPQDFAYVPLSVDELEVRYSNKMNWCEGKFSAAKSPRILKKEIVATWERRL